MAFKKYFEQRFVSEWKPRAPHQYVSAASIKDRYGDTLGACQRKEWFRLMSCKPTDHKNLTSKIILGCGNMIEDELVAQLERADRLVAHGVKLYWKKMNLSGEIDVIAKDEDDETVFVEVKSYGGFFAKNQIMGPSQRRGNGWGRRGPGTPRESAIMQMALYLVMKDVADITPGRKVEYDVDAISELVKTIDTGYLVYIDREAPQNVTEYKIKIKDGGVWYRAVGFDNIEPTLFCTVKEMLANVIELNDCVANEVIPPRSFHSLYDKDRLADAARRGTLTAKEQEVYDDKGWVKKTDWQCKAFKDDDGKLHGLYCQYHHLCGLVDLEDFTLSDHRVPLEEDNE